MKSQGISPNSAVYNAVVFSLNGAGNFAKAKIYLEEMKSAGLQPDVHTHANSVFLSTHSRDVHIGAGEKYHFNPMIWYFHKRKDWKSMLMVYEKMKETKAWPAVWTCKLLLDTAVARFPPAPNLIPFVEDLQKQLQKYNHRSLPLEIHIRFELLLQRIISSGKFVPLALPQVREPQKKAPSQNLAEVNTLVTHSRVTNSKCQRCGDKGHSFALCPKVFLPAVQFVR
jgi:pentatricopeptide repeat protein